MPGASGQGLLGTSLDAYVQLTLCVLMWGVVGLLVGMLTRSAGISIGIGIGYLMIFEGLAGMLLDSSQKWLPGSAFSAIAAGGSSDMAFGTAVLVAGALCGRSARADCGHVPPPRHHGVSRSHAAGGGSMTADDESRKTDTRQVLIDAATEVFLKRGFSRATTKEIAQTAGLAEGTIYRHFDDKYALFHEVFLARSGETIEGLARFPERAGQRHRARQPGRSPAADRRMAEHATSLMASMWADPEVAERFEAYVKERAPKGLEAGPVGIVAAYIRAEQELGRIRGDVAAGGRRGGSRLGAVRKCDGPGLRDRLPNAGGLPGAGPRRSRHPRAGTGATDGRVGVAPTESAGPAELPLAGAPGGRVSEVRLLPVPSSGWRH